MPSSDVLRAEANLAMAAVHEAMPPTGFRGSAQRLMDRAPQWMLNALRCINPAAPHMGMSEISSYVSHVITRYPEAVQIEVARTWARNPPHDSLWASIKDANGYCCSLDQVLDKAARHGMQYVGLELGHTTCTAEYATRKEFFKASPYPPTSDPFWTSRNVTFWAKGRELDDGDADPQVKTSPAS